MKAKNAKTPRTMFEWCWGDVYKYLSGSLVFGFFDQSGRDACINNKH